VPTVPVADTLRRFVRSYAVADVHRDDLFQVQTPQGFDYDTIVRAHADARFRAATDDASLIMAVGGEVVQVAGDPQNIKVTVAEDIAVAEASLLARPVRWATGLGFDVHRFAPGRRLMLLGVEVAHEMGLEGHSDADVGLHALTDAVLGAIGAGDIGQHFPPSDARWQGGDSMQFLLRAKELATEAGATIEHVDITVIGERPKVAPYRARMRERVSEILVLPTGRVNVKATTTEGLGFTGRGEGLAAQAVATVAFRG
jgi:2-C-methyl-D-erythritol 4-phosphate cytidylyltransferase / 2-C-methyl-D-erythritol 2,4-cyclodiphosphate synthase